jgi:acetyltransferase EpsM
MEEVEATQTAAEWQDSAGATGRSGIAVIGAGQHGRVVASVLEAAGLPVAGHYDEDPDTWGSELGNSSVIGAPDRIPSDSRAIIAIGDNETRRQVAERLDLDWVTVVHPFSWLHPDVRLGPGTVVCSGVSVQVGAGIGAHVILNNHAGVGHDACVGDLAHLTVAHIGGESRAGEGAFLGIGSVVLPRVRVGAWATVGAGAVVMADVQPGATVIGNPARQTISRRLVVARPASS